MRQKIFTFIFLFFLLTASSLHAANISFSPSTGTVGTSGFTVDVYVTNNTQPINAVSGVVAFPADQLSVASISKTGSIISIWAEEPSFSNTAGSVRFEGVILNPGFSGIQGKVLSIRFAKKPQSTESQAIVRLTAGSVLANDGLATNTLGTLGTARLTLVQSAPQVIQAPQTTPAATLTLFSDTHPDSVGWYSNNKPSFSWQLPEGVSPNAVRLGFGKSEEVSPIRSYTPPIFERRLDELADGVYYFAAQARVGSSWTPVTRTRFQIDSTPPEPFTISGDATKIAFATTDNLSGIARYEVSINGQTPVPLVETTNSYELPTDLPAGESIVVVKAYDNAGNATEASIAITITPKPLEQIVVSTPSLDRLPFGLTSDQILYVLLGTLIVLTIAIIWYAVIRFSLLRAKMRHELTHISETLRDDFVTLREHLDLHAVHIPPRSKVRTELEKVFKNSQDTIELVERDIGHKIDVLKKKL